MFVCSRTCECVCEIVSLRHPQNGRDHDVISKAYDDVTNTFLLSLLLMMQTTVSMLPTRRPTTVRSSPINTGSWRMTIFRRRRYFRSAMSAPAVRCEVGSERLSTDYRISSIDIISIEYVNFDHWSSSIDARVLYTCLIVIYLYNVFNKKRRTFQIYLLILIVCFCLQTVLI